jgi:putative redox protein
MAETKSVQSVMLDGPMKYQSTMRGFAPLVSDYPAPHGTDQGPCSLELFLAALTTCAGNSIALLLRRMHKSVDGLSVGATGTQRASHPMGFETIVLDLVLTSSDAGAEDLAKAVSMAESTICPVWSMIKGNVEVKVESRIQRP